jgi:hypothetical protein
MQRWGHEPPIEETALAQDTCGKGENDRGGLSEDEISVRDGISTLRKENRHRVKTLGEESERICASVTPRRFSSSSLYFLFIFFFLFISSQLRASRRFCVPPDQRMIYEKTNSYSQRNYAERRRDACFGLHASDERECRNVTQRPGDQQNSRPPGTSSLRKVRLHGHIGPTRNRRHSLIAAQLAHPEKRIHGRHWDPKRHHDRRQPHKISVHNSSSSRRDSIRRRHG